MRLPWIKVGPDSNDRCPLRERRGIFAIQIHGDMANENGGRDWGDAVTNPGMP